MSVNLSSKYRPIHGFEAFMLKWAGLVRVCIVHQQPTEKAPDTCPDFSFPQCMNLHVGHVLVCIVVVTQDPTSYIHIHTDTPSSEMCVYRLYMYICCTKLYSCT